MWEAVAAPQRLPELVDWILQCAIPELIATDPATRAEIYRSADERLVIIATGSECAPHIASAPEKLCLRAPHQWTFECVSSDHAADHTTKEPSP